MDFKQLLETCDNGIFILCESCNYYYENPNQFNLSKRRCFNLGKWRQRVEECAKGIDFCGGVLASERGNNRREDEERNLNHQLKLSKLNEHAEQLVKLVQQLSASSCGQYYRLAVCDAACSTLTALKRLPELYTNCSDNISVAFVWNQTLQLRDLPDNCLTHILVKWERWTGQMRGTIEDLDNLLQKYDNDDDSQESSSLEGSSFERDEYNTTVECQLVIKLVKTLLKKIKVRCIRGMDPDVEPLHVIFIDSIYPIVQELSIIINEFPFHLSPALNMPRIAQCMAIITNLSGELCELGMEQCATEHQKWFSSCSRSLDNMLYSILERNPNR